MALASINGSMDDATRVNGTKIIWRVWEFILGLMGECTKVYIETTKSTVSGSISGLTVATTKAIGLKVNSTD